MPHSRHNREDGISMGMIIAIISGALRSIQGVFNTKVTETTGVWTANAFVQFTALLVCLVAGGITERNSFMELMKVEPKYMLLGGVMGAAITWTVIQSMKSLGPAKAVLFIVVAQILVAYLIELFGIFGAEKQSFEMKKLIGMGLAIVGIIIFKWE